LLWPRGRKGEEIAAKKERGEETKKMSFEIENEEQGHDI
jgi:hypothetical protein